MFLQEEMFEYGNPKSQGNIQLSLDKDSLVRAQAAHYWRKEIERRGYGAFHDMRAIINLSKRDPMKRLIEAGGGMVIEAR